MEEKGVAVECGMSLESINRRLAKQEEHLKMIALDKESNDLDLALAENKFKIALNQHDRTNHYITRWEEEVLRERDRLLSLKAQKQKADKEKDKAYCCEY